jgi:hypothetical protein
MTRRFLQEVYLTDTDSIATHVSAACKPLKHTDNGEKLTVWERNFKSSIDLFHFVKYLRKLLTKKRK